jgi:hypothetical protein
MRRLRKAKNGKSTFSMGFQRETAIGCEQFYHREKEVHPGADLLSKVFG